MQTIKIIVDFREAMFKVITLSLGRLWSENLYDLHIHSCFTRCLNSTLGTIHMCDHTWKLSPLAIIFLTFRAHRSLGHI